MKPFMYTQANHGKLQPSVFYQLPAGAVVPNGFLHYQLTALAQGLTGEMEKFPDYHPNTSEWRGGTGENWERGPYYLRGLVALAYVLDDEPLKAKAQSWIESILSSQRGIGMFGPISNEEWWSRMPVLMALRDYYEAKLLRGEEDERIIPFMERYFRCQLQLLPERPLRDWAHARGGDNIDSVLWLYTKLYNTDDPDGTDWLLELARLIASQTQDWVTIMQDTTVREHVVNTSQAMKTPPLLWQLSGDTRAKDALTKGLSHIAVDHGRIDELPNSDEAARENYSHRGSELCGIVEGMLSTEIAIRILGNANLCDHLETLAYNALPSGYSYDYLGHVYYILQNQVLATNGYHGFECDHGDSSAFGAPCGYDCCFSNHHMGWPKFVQSMWMATPDGGLVATSYGPCKVCATVAGGKNAVFEMITDYPFRDTVRLIYQGEDAIFPLWLRIPGWSHATTLTVCGEGVSAPVGEFISCPRHWTAGDTVELTFAAQVSLSHWYNRSVGVRRGALIYAYPIAESWRNLGDNDARELKVPARGKTFNREVLPKTPWNMSILEQSSSFEPEESPMTDHPFVPNTAPISLSVRMKKRSDWHLAGNVPSVAPCGCCVGEIVETKLIPYGSSRLKLSHIPSAECAQQVLTASPVVENGNSYFTQLVLPVAASYSLTFSGTPGAHGTLFINDRQFGRIMLDQQGHYTRDIPAENGRDGLRFAPEQYNQIRAEGITLHTLTVPPCTRPILSASLTDSGHAITLRTSAEPCHGAIYGEYLDGDNQVILTVRNLEQMNRLPAMHPVTAVALRIVQQINGETASAEPILLPVSREINTPTTFPITTDTAAEIVRIRFPKIEGADRYLIQWGRDDIFTEWESNVRFNPYKGSSCFAADITAFTVPGGGKIQLQMWALRDGVPVACSHIVTVNCRCGE